MKMVIESTPKVIQLVVNGKGIPARIWEGTTDYGVHCIVYVTRVQVDGKADTSQFERELQEQKPPSAEVQAIPLRLIL